MAITVLNYTPGQIVEILHQITDGYVRVDGYSTPVISRVILPDFTTSPLYPLNMVRISTGLYYHKFTLPTGSAALGTYIVDLSWTDPANNTHQDIIQVVVSASYGLFSVSPG